MRRARRTFSLLLLLAAMLPASATRVRVTADRVCLRAAAQETSEVVGQVNTADELVALSDVGDEWVQVVPPSSVDLWVFGELVHGGAVIVSKAQVRAGAGLNFNVVGSLRRGAQVTERGRLGDWLKIAPPEGTVLWVNRNFIQPLPGGGVAAAPAPVEAAPAPVAVPDAVPAPPPPALPATEPLPAPAPPALPALDPRYPEVPVPGTAAPVPAPVTPEPSSAPAAPTAPEVVVAPVTVPTPSPAATPSVATPVREAPQVVLEPVAPLATAPIPAFAPPVVPDPSVAAGWENTAARAGAATTSAAPVTTPPRVRPRVLLPQQSDAYRTVGPAKIPADRLVPGIEQGRPGRLTGQLARAGALFFTPSDHRLVVINATGRAVTVGYVLGNESQLAALNGSRLTIEGPVYWFKSTQYPTIVAERLQRQP